MSPNTIFSPNDTMQVEVRDNIAHVVFHRPAHLNALNGDMVIAASAIFKAIRADQSIRCVVLSGSGEHFMAGGDIRAFKDIVDGESDKSVIRHQFQRLITDMHEIILDIRQMPIPVIASVRGGLAGAGVSFALACDMIIASDTAFFTLAYCHLGVNPDGGSTFELPRAVGIKRAFEIALLGDRFSAQTAKDWGLVNFVVEDDQLEGETDVLLARLAGGPGLAYAHNKALLNMSLDNDLETQLEQEASRFADCTTTDDFDEGLSAFLEKRKPRFTNT